MTEPDTCNHCGIETTDKNPKYHIHKEGGTEVWSGCIQCLIVMAEEHVKLKERGIIDCICKHLWQGCKCGAMQRERYFKKAKQLQRV